jgi:lipopolysaccharide exporter
MIKSCINYLKKNNRGYFYLVVKSTFWVAGLRAFIRSLTFIRIAILARILTPSQFGVYGIVSFVLSFVEMLTETGINVFLIQQKKSYKKFINTAWIISIVRGIVIAGVIIIAAPFISQFFNSDESYNLILLSSLIPLIRGFINPSIVQFQKDLKFSKDFLFRSVIVIVEVSSSIMLAVITRSESALIWSMIISASLEVALSFLFLRPTPKLVFSKGYFSKIIHSGKWVTIAGITNYLFHNADDIVVGRLLNTYSLGLYQMAYKISIFPITEISDVIARVTFPVFVKINNDKKRLQKAFLKTMVIVTVLSVIFGGILFIFTEDLVKLALGEKWIEIVPFLRVLTLFGVVRGISGTTSMLFLSVKKQKYVSVVTTASFVVLMIWIFPLITTYQLMGASVAALLAAICVVPLMIYYTVKVLREE